MVPVSEIIDRVRIRYDAESGGDASRFDDDAVRLFINEGLETLSEATGFYERYVVVPISQERTWYDLRGFTNETVVNVKSVWSTSWNDWLIPTTEEQLDINWEDSRGTPTHFFTRGIYWMGVYPRPEAGTEGVLRVHYAGIPSRFGHPQAVLGELPTSWIPALEDYALYEMAALDRQTQLALLHWKSYATREKQLSNFVDRRLVAAVPGRLGGLG